MSEAEHKRSQIRVELWRMIINETAQEQYMVLREKDGGRTLSIAIGTFEALAIDRVVKRRPTPRPLTHDLLLSALAALGAEVQAAVIEALQGDTYHAHLDLSAATGRVLVDARPSDAVALAILASAPILIDEQVMDLVGARDSAHG